MPGLDLSELGSTGLDRSGGTITEEFLSELRGQRGRRLYREMRDNDPTVGAVLLALQLVVRRLDWRVVPSDPALQEAQDNAEFIDGCLNDMSESWDATLSTILSMLSYGWSFHEIVYKRRIGPEEEDPKLRSKFRDGKIGWRKWPIRAQETLSEWEISDEGSFTGMIQQDPASGVVVTIPMVKALLFRTDSAKANPEGRSVLRNAVRPWYFKRRIEEIEAIGVERDLAGLPVAYLPPDYLSQNATNEQKAVKNAVQKIVTSIKRNEQEGVIFPAVFDANNNRVMDLTLLSSGGSRQFDTDKIIARYDQRIAMTILSDFLLLGQQAVGSFALSTSKMDLWSMAVETIAKAIAEVVNQHAIPRLLRLNGIVTDNPPELMYGEVNAANLEEISNYVEKLAQHGLLTPDEELEGYLRTIGGLPAQGV